MKKTIIFLTVFFLYSIAIGEEAVVMKMSEIVKVGNVVVKPNTEYDIDFREYAIPKDAKLLIFHVLDSPKSHYYYQEIKAEKSLYKMNADTLKATTGSPPFKGLKNTDATFLIIGSEVEPGSINMGILYANVSISVIVRN